MSDRIHIAEPNPSHCSSCFSQKPHMRHVDFSAFWDGPVFDDVAGGKKMTIDDLILCEDCIRTAASLVDLGNVEAERQEVDQLKAELADTQRQLRTVNEVAAALEAVRAGVDKLTDSLGEPDPKPRRARARASA